MAWQRRRSNMYVVKSVIFIENYFDRESLFRKYNSDCTQVSGEKEPSQWAYTLSNSPSPRSSKKNIDININKKGNKTKHQQKHPPTYLVSLTLESAYCSNFGRRRVARPHFPFLFLTNPALNQSKSPILTQ